MLLHPTATYRFLSESGIPRTRASRNAYRDVLAHLASSYPGKELDQYNTGDLTKFCLGSGLAPATIKHRRTIVRQAFEWFAYQKMVKLNPANDLKFTVRPGHDFGVRENYWLTEAEVALVLRSCPDDDRGRRARVVFLHGFMLGLRREEIAGLKWDDYTRDLSRVNVLGKGRKPVQLGVPPQLRVELQAWRRTAGLGATAVVPSLHAGPFDRSICWTTSVGGDCIATVCQDGNKWSGVFFRAHDMRRSFAGILETKGVQVQDISRLLRHSDVGTTSRYLEKNPNKVASMADTFVLEL